MLFMVSNIFPIDKTKVENGHISEQLQSLEDENANLKRQVELQKAAC